MRRRQLKVVETAASRSALWIAALAVLALSPWPRGVRANSLPSAAQAAKQGEAADGDSLAALRAGLAAVADPDPIVRTAQIELLGRADLAELAEERAAALELRARIEPRSELRQMAAAALGRVDHSSVPARLDSLLDSTRGADSRAVARALLRLPDAGDRVLARVRSAFAGTGEKASDSEVAPGALALLLEGYGRVLAERWPDLLDSERASLRAPLMWAARDPDVRLRTGAALALDEVVQRSLRLRRNDQAREFLSQLALDGFDSREIDYRLARLALTQGDDPLVALAPARRLADSPATAVDPSARMYRFYGELFLAAVALATERPKEAKAPLESAATTLDGLRNERFDLRPRSSRRVPEQGAQAVDIVHLRGLVEVYRLLVMLEAGVEPNAPSSLERARQAHIWVLRAQLLKHVAHLDSGATGWDSVIARDLGPRELVYSNRSNPNIDSDAAARSMGRLGAVLAAVSPLELPGFEPLEDVPPAVSDPLRDPERFALLIEIQDEEIRHTEDRFFRALRSEWPDRDEIRLLRSRLERMQRDLAAGRAASDAEEALEPADDPAWEFLRMQRLPSAFALDLAVNLRIDGNPEASRRLAERMLKQVESTQLWDAFYWKTELVTNLEVAIGSAYTDEGDPQRAEEQLLMAVSRIEEMENAFKARLERVKGVSAAGAAALDGADREAAADPDDVRLWTSQIRRLESRRADVLVSLAVNANVRLVDPERAVEFFERAYALVENDFMRVLLACYRARMGRDAEARAVLREVAVLPALYYNLACTYALLGDVEPALDFLRRELAENHPTLGTLVRQKEWAAGDPDLASLRDEPRFQQLIKLD